MHLQLLQAVEGLLALLAAEVLLGLALSSFAPPGGWHELRLVQDLVLVGLGSRGHGALWKSSNVD